MNFRDANSIVSSETPFLESFLESYSEIFNEVLRENWLNICCSMTINQTLIASQCRFRLTKLRPLEEYIDYWPSILKEHRNMIRFFRAVMEYYFIRNRVCIFANFGIDWIIQPDQDVQTRGYVPNSL